MASNNMALLNNASMNKALENKASVNIESQNTVYTFAHLKR